MNSKSNQASRFYKIALLAAALFAISALFQNYAFAAQTITGTTINATTLNATTITGTYSGTLGAANVSAGIFGSNTGNGTFIFPAGVQLNAANNTGYVATNNSGTYWGIFGNYGPNDWRIGYGSPTALTGWNLRWDASGNVWTAGALGVGGAASAGSFTSPTYYVTAGNGYGICFWGDCTNYTITMGYGANYWYGPLSDYSIKMTMNSQSPVRGFTWGPSSGAPTAALTTAGTMQIAGTFTSGSDISSGNIVYAVSSFRVNGSGNTIQDSNQFYCNNSAGCYFNWSSSGVTNVGNSAGVYMPGRVTTGGNIYPNGQTTYGLYLNSGVFDTVNTGSAGDPLELNYYTAGDVRIVGGDVTMADNRYLYPGSITAGYGYQKNWYLASSPSWGLYTNTSFNAAGGLYDAGNRVWSPGNFVNQDGTRNGADLNGRLMTGFYDIDNTAPNRPTDWIQLISVRGIDTGLQIAGGYASDNLWFRGWWSYGAGFSAWRRVLTDANMNVSQFSNDSGYLVSGSSPSFGTMTASTANATYSTLTYLYVNTQICNASCSYFWSINNGNLTAAGVWATSYNTSSDITLKANVKTIPNALDNVLKLRGVEFNWKKDGKADIGVVAQEVEKVYPQLVSTNATSGLKSVEYGNLVGPLIEATKELKHEKDSDVDKLQNQINSQQKMINELQKEIKGLKSKIK